jgi:osmotically-inducible protein OsmY
MKNYVSKFAMFVALSCGFALAQSMPQQQTPQTAPSSPSASQPAPDQSQPAQPDQSTSEGKSQTSSPDAMPKSDQDKDKDQSKMPQSDASAASAGDVQSQIQTALQQDPKLANANITVNVKGKNLELTGTVPSNDEKKQAEQIAKSNAGNLKVKNHIKVASGNMPGQDKDKNPKQQ